MRVVGADDERNWAERFLGAFSMILVIMEKNVLVVYDSGFVKEANACSKASRRETCTSQQVSFFEALRQVEPVRSFGAWEW